MQFLNLVLRVEDNFKKGNCKKCPLSNYVDSFGEQACCEGHSNDKNCPLELDNPPKDTKINTEFTELVKRQEEINKEQCEITKTLREKYLNPIIDSKDLNRLNEFIASVGEGYSRFCAIDALCRLEKELGIEQNPISIPNKTENK